MEVQDVEFVGALTYAVELEHVIGDGIAHIAVEAQCHGGTRHEFRAGHRVAARKQRHVVSEPHQLVCQIRNDPFGSAIEPRRHAFHKGRDLRNLHCRLQLGFLAAQRHGI